MGSEHGGSVGPLCATRLLNIPGENGALSSSSSSSSASVSSPSSYRYHQQQQGQQQGAVAAAAHAYNQLHHLYKPAGASLSGGSAEGMNEMGTQYLHSSMISGGRAPFTSGQWAEFAHQDLIFKYMMAGLNVPQELLNPICRSGPAQINGLTSCHNAANLRWGSAHRGVQSNTDLEPGRCRRTDGKKWRCGRDVVPDQKYCEKHMHRGRHRPRRNAEGQAATGSPSGTATSSSGAAVSGTTNVGPIRTSTPMTSASSFSLSNLQRPSNLSVKSFSSSLSSSPGSGGGSSPAASSQFGQLSSLTSSPSAASTFASKDYRYLASSVMKSEQQAIGSEQSILSSETLGSTRGQSQESQMLSNWSRLQSVNQSWHSLLPSKVPAPHESKVNSNSCSSGLIHYGHSTQLRGQLLGQDFGLLPDQTGQLDVTAGMSAAQQQAYAVSNAYGGAESVSVQAGRESEGQPLRHFFDDWPRSHDRSTMTSWGSGSVDEPEEHSNSDMNLTHIAPNINNTQLSISIPITTASSAQHPSSPTAGTFSFSHASWSM